MGWRDRRFIAHMSALDQNGLAGHRTGGARSRNRSRSRALDTPPGLTHVPGRAIALGIHKHLGHRSRWVAVSASVGLGAFALQCIENLLTE